ncbi:hypothetical protein ABZN20_16760 [Methylococcus sp. ANG]|uniref:hypothetical protein n=1 Tax=unclassified Methylococcus TaxID=2618889 RepID=UPI001C533B37|nr:hypothetical protein [Methylococcus sp. Mc7]QXP85938.1 hypothetical protein KW115_09730 [Methylococcus sp. Mc7]
MPIHALTRITAVFITALIASQTTGVLWSSLFWSIAFVHYGLALYYSRHRILAVAKDASSLAPALAVLSGGLALYASQFSLLVYFGVHHVFNEVYLLDRKFPVTEGEQRRGLRVAAVLLNAAIYAALLRHYSELAWIGPAFLFGGLFFFYGLFFYRLNQMRPVLGVKGMIDSSIFEVFGLLLVLSSFFVRFDLNHIVLYHFIFWSLYPIEKFKRLGDGALWRYAAMSVVMVAGFILFSPAGVAGGAVSESLYYQQFIFWSYAHITLSFVLSDAHPAWITRWFRSGRRQWAVP